MVEARWQLANAQVDDDQRHSTSLLVPLLEHLLEEMKTLKLLCECLRSFVPFVSLLLRTSSH